MIPDKINTKKEAELNLEVSHSICSNCTATLPVELDMITPEVSHKWEQLHEFKLGGVVYKDVLTRGGVSILKEGAKMCPLCAKEYESAHWTRFGKVLVIIWY